jgi:hypothetical protein
LGQSEPLLVLLEQCQGRVWWEAHRWPLHAQLQAQGRWWWLGRLLRPTHGLVWVLVVVVRPRLALRWRLSPHPLHEPPGPPMWRRRTLLLLLLLRRVVLHLPPALRRHPFPPPPALLLCPHRCRLRRQLQPLVHPHLHLHLSPRLHLLLRRRPRLRLLQRRFLRLLLRSRARRRLLPATSKSSPRSSKRWTTLQRKILRRWMRTRCVRGSCFAAR